MYRFASEEILTFLRAADRHLKKPFSMTVIGGAAAALSFGAKRPTMDIDTVNSVLAHEEVWKRAAKESGIDIPISSCGVFEAPYFFEQRQRRVLIRGLKNLFVFVPEKHDWALIDNGEIISEHLHALNQTLWGGGSNLKQPVLLEVTLGREGCTG